MRKLSFFWIFILFVIGGFFVTKLVFQTKSTKTIKPLVISVSPTMTPSIVTATSAAKTLIVPYWTLTQQQIDTIGYNQLVYFGITINKDGIDTQDPGYKNLKQFFSLTDANHKRLLGIRMINSDVNTGVLNDKALQQKIIDQSIQIAKAEKFDGILLDFEISALGFDSVIKNISNFEKTFAAKVKESNITFYTTMYGDTFVRLRPFDVQDIANHADGIYIMAYDFHKANGNPGPNFPFHDNQSEGYDFTAMTTDFLRQVPSSKITVIFGLYGYDWLVDDKNNSIQQASSLSDNIINQKFLHSCTFSNCKVTTDQISAEKEITYTDKNNQNHIIWFEDLDSVAKKTAFLKSKGIGSTAYWAYSYF